MTKRLRTLPTIALLIGLLAACGQPQPTPIPTPTPTQVVPTPEPPVPTPTVVPAAGEPLYLSIIWHQHQPVYFKDPETGIYQKPWVRLHAAKDYVDMAATLERYPDIVATFNLTPSLLRQLEDLEGGAVDLYQVHTEIPADQLSDAQKAFVIGHFFDINPK
ncbi:MAG TPA: hypothetical protein VM537_30355, partial [Anaerolineae bacterium]|nr:hypothetical protein [Anaerolineae bacterium]